MEYFGELPLQKFQWTGGYCFKNYIYGFPRTSNQLLKINVIKKEVKVVDLGLNYRKEHHYGSVFTENGYIYQSPRNEDHILVINLNTYCCHSISLAPKWMKMKLRYCGSILHPNGYIFFLPEYGEKVIKFNPNTDEFQYIGDFLDCMVFDAVVAADGNIYVFSAYARGILKINVKHDTTEMIHQKLFPRCYGTKLGVNGRLYGIPGDGNEFLEFDINNNIVKSVGKIMEEGNAKCAGGAMNHYGDIFCIPAMGNYLYKLCFERTKGLIPKNLYNTFFSDNY